MTLQLRPLGISFLVHLLLFGLFLFWLTRDKPEKLSVPLKIQISSFSPTVVAVQAPINSIQPHTQPPLQKPIPAPVKIPIAKPRTPAPIVAVPAVSVPMQVQPKTLVPRPIQESPSVEAPKPAVAAVPATVINVEKEFLDAHLGEIRGLLLQNFKYPKMAQKLKMQGEVQVAFSLEKDGSVESVKVIESSGFDILDYYAVALINKTAPSFPKPTKSIRISVPLSYVLR
jgi:TonB family protein